MISEAYNVDCMEYMRTLPDNAFDLAICDPPYGDGLHAEDGGGKGWFTKYNQKAPESDYNKSRHAPLRFHGGDRWNKYIHDRPDSKIDSTKPVTRTGGDGGGWKNSVYGKKIIEWDVAPGREYFEEIFRVSRNQIIWGGNYFELPPNRCFLVWRKLTISESFTMAMAEYAWTSFNSNAKVYECAPQGKPGDERFHPTQKPLDLYRWIYGLYTEPGQKVFDPFLGSGSSRIAAWDAGLDFVGCEIDPVYFAKQEERFASYTSQTRIEGF